MTGPTSISQVLARIGQIESQLGVGHDAVVLPGLTTPGTAPLGSSAGPTPFASVLADAARPADAVTAATAWPIPWLGGEAPGAPAAAAASRGAASAVQGSAGHGSSRVVWPVRGAITQRFGPTTCTLEPSATVNGHTYAHYHDGLDIGAALGTPVQSMAAGTVEFAGRYPDGAMVVRVRHADGSVALYAHLQPDLAVKAGDTVHAGDTLGHVGMTGHTTGPHLHLEFTSDGRKVDPLDVIEAGELPGSAPSGSARWQAASPLAASCGAISQPALDRFDAVAAQIPHHVEIREAAVRAGIDPLLLTSLVKAESGFRPDAVSSAGALGMCQLMPATAKSLGVTDPFDPVQNLRAGARYFANNLRIYGRADLALAAYHDGKGAVASAGGVPDHPVTHRYIDRILSYWTHYREAAA